MKFLKKNIKVIAGMLIGILLTGGIVFATSQLNASEVTYNTNTVAGALDNLYNYAKNKSDLVEQMNKPNTWVVGTEYNFGDGLYGQRFTGNITTTAVETTTIVTVSSTLSTSNITLVSEGGYLENTVGNRHSFSAPATSAFQTGIWMSVGNGLTIGVTPKNSAAVGTIPYNIWVLYTK